MADIEAEKKKKKESWAFRLLGVRIEVAVKTQSRASEQSDERETKALDRREFRSLALALVVLSCVIALNYLYVNLVPGVYENLPVGDWGIFALVIILGASAVQLFRRAARIDFDAQYESKPRKENLTTENAPRLISDSHRTLRLDYGNLEALKQQAASSGSEIPKDSRGNFHVVKDGQSAYVILKTKEFIVDAMDRLERRGTRFYTIATASFVIAVCVLVAAIAVAYVSMSGPQSKLDPYSFVIRLVQILGYSGLLLVIVKMLLAVSRACMHEAVKNFERRHAMRFGWLYMELKGRDWDFEQLQEAFQWNREAVSAFRDIDLKHVSETTLNILLARLNEMVHSSEGKLSEKTLDGLSKSRGKSV